MSSKLDLLPKYAGNSGIIANTTKLQYIRYGSTEDGKLYLRFLTFNQRWSVHDQTLYVPPFLEKYVVDNYEEIPIPS